MYIPIYFEALFHLGEMSELSSEFIIGFIEKKLHLETNSRVFDFISAA